MSNEIKIQGLTKNRLFEIIGEIGREIGIRKNVYPKWIQSGRLPREIADKQMNNLASAHEILKFIYANSAQDVQLKLFTVSH